VELGISDPFAFTGMNLPVPYLGFFGEYVDNFDVSTKGDGWAAGFKLGYNKIADKNQWQLAYNYRFLERNAWMDTFPDSDFYSGKTNAKGHNVIFQYGLSKNSYLNLEYYCAKNMTRLTDDPESSRLPAQVLQADWNIKF
jgi:hypothetical protein